MNNIGLSEAVVAGSIVVTSPILLMVIANETYVCNYVVPLLVSDACQRMKVGNLILNSRR